MNGNFALGLGGQKSLGLYKSVDLLVKCNMHL